MGKIKPKLLGDSAKDAAPKVSLKTIVKPKDKLKVVPVVQTKIQDVKCDFPKRPTLPALKRKQKAKKQKRVSEENAATTPSTPVVHQKKHVKMAEKKKKLALKFELMLKEQKETQRLKKVEKANKKIGSVATLGALKDALPSLDSLFKFKGSQIKTGIPEYDSIKVAKGTEEKKEKKKGQGKEKNNKFALKEKRISKQSKEQTQRYEYLQKLMNDKGFRNNPRQVIAEHIKNTKLEQEAAQ